MIGVMGGCRGGNSLRFDINEDAVHYEQVVEHTPPPEVPIVGETGKGGSLPPRRIADHDDIEYQDITLAEVVRVSLETSEVMHDIGGRVITAPTGVVSLYDPAIQDTNGFFGTEAALAAFDAQWATSMFFTRSDSALNSVNPVSGGPNFLNQNSSIFRTQVTKNTAYGGQLSLSNLTNYDNSAAPGRLFADAYDTTIEAGVRQPLLQGAGLDINRIAGPNALPGFFFGNGVVIARLNTDVSVADFELAVITLLNDVEDAYWDLSFAYRDLAAKLAARDAALETWRRIRALYEVGRRGGEAENEAQALQQYLQFEAQVQDALSGTSTGTGIYANERRLRRLMGLPPNDGKLLRPADEPARAEIYFDWEQVLPEAFVSRVELRRQRIVVHRRELELLAARNFLLPRLDLVGNYRFRGFGDDLINNRDAARGTYSSAFGNLFDGNHQEWDVGFEFTVPTSFRQATANMRNGQLNLARERAILAEQELEISHGLSAAITEMDRAFHTMQTNYNLFLAARKQVDAVERAYSVGRVTFDVLAEAQRQRADAESAYHRSMVEYTKAIKDVHFAKGTLPIYHGVMLAEGPWPLKAYRDAERIRSFPYRFNYGIAGAVKHGRLPPDLETPSVPPSMSAAPQMLAPKAEIIPLPDVGQEFLPMAEPGGLRTDPMDVPLGEPASGLDPAFTPNEP